MAALQTRQVEDEDHAQLRHADHHQVDRCLSAHGSLDGLRTQPGEPIAACLREPTYTLDCTPTATWQVLMIATEFTDDDSPMNSWLGSYGYCVQRSNSSTSLPWGYTWSLRVAATPSAPAVYCVSSTEQWLATYYWMIMLISGAAGGDVKGNVFTTEEQTIFTFLVIMAAFVNAIVIAACTPALHGSHLPRLYTAPSHSSTLHTLPTSPSRLHTGRTHRTRTPDLDR
jgi:hypothetical protein